MRSTNKKHIILKPNDETRTLVGLVRDPHLGNAVTENTPLEDSFIVCLSKKISNDQELIQSDPISCPQNQKGNN